MCNFETLVTPAAMGFSCGIVGLPNVGKSTLFNALTAAGAQAENYPFCTIDPNVGVVPVRDPRLYKIAEIFKPKSIVPTSMEFVDIAGLVRGASKGEGLGNQFLGHIRQVDAIAHVVRCFEETDITHVEGSIDPIRDLETIFTELCLADLETATKAADRANTQAKGNDPKLKAKAKIFADLRDHLAEGKSAKLFQVDKEYEPAVRELALLTRKPAMYLCNIAESDIGKSLEQVKRVREYAQKENAEVVEISAKVEAEISELSPEERRNFLEELGLKESGLDRVIQAGYNLLGLITFFTAGEKECRAWTIPNGYKAPQAAGKIHSDFEKGFIRAEIYHYDDLLELGSEANVKAKGKNRLEGKEYIMKDGDICFFRFNV